MRRYRGRLSGPLLDRMDVQLEVGSVRGADLRHRSLFRGETEAARRRVHAAREAQAARAATYGVATVNARLTPAALERIAPLEPVLRQRLASAMETLGLSARGFHRTWRLARTLADLAGHDAIRDIDLDEALMLRRADARKAMEAEAT